MVQGSQILSQTTDKSSKMDTQKIEIGDHVKLLEGIEPLHKLPDGVSRDALGTVTSANKNTKVSTIHSKSCAFTDRCTADCCRVTVCILWCLLKRINFGSGLRLKRR